MTLATLKQSRRGSVLRLFGELDIAVGATHFAPGRVGSLTMLLAMHISFFETRRIEGIIIFAPQSP